MKGWFNQNYRHSLAARGIKTSLKTKSLTSSSLYSKRSNFADGWLSKTVGKGWKSGVEGARKRYRLPDTYTYKPESLKYVDLVPTEEARLPEVMEEARRKQESPETGEAAVKRIEREKWIVNLDRIYKEMYGPEWTVDHKTGAPIRMSELEAMSDVREAGFKNVVSGKLKEPIAKSGITYEDDVTSEILYVPKEAPYTVEYEEQNEN